ncbi:MAG: hypothetical protein ACTHKM_10040 [Tsuneonella sp.]
MTRARAETYAAVFAVVGAPLAWLGEISTAYAFASTPCFRAGQRMTREMGVQPWPLAISAAFLLVALAALAMGVALFRRTHADAAHSRTRFLAMWGIAFATIFAALIVVNIALLLGMPACAS